MPPRARQVLWFLALWTAGVVTVAGLSYGIRLWMA